MATTTDTRTMTLVDLPLIRRLTAQGMILDTEMRVTRDGHGPNGSLLTRLLFPRGTYTLVAHSDEHPVVGQIRYRPDDLNAHIVYLAPAWQPDNTSVEQAMWLTILDAMTREAGKHGAHSLIAEVDALSPMFELLRTARFSTYARQIIWRSDATIQDDSAISVTLSEEHRNDQLGITALITNSVPTIIQQAAAPHSDMSGLVLRHSDRIMAYVAYSEGPSGVYLLPFMHKDVVHEAADIIKAAMLQIDPSEKVPVYVCVRSYQGWLGHTLASMGFEDVGEQAVMVKQIAAGIRHPSFSRVAVNKHLKAVSNTPYYGLTPDNCNYEDM